MIDPNVPDDTGDVRIYRVALPSASGASAPGIACHNCSIGCDDVFDSEDDVIYHLDEHREVGEYVDARFPQWVAEVFA